MFVNTTVKLLKHIYFTFYISYACVECGKDLMSYFASSSSFSRANPLGKIQFGDYLKLKFLESKNVCFLSTTLPNTIPSPFWQIKAITKFQV